MTAKKTDYPQRREWEANVNESLQRLADEIGNIGHVIQQMDQNMNVLNRQQQILLRNADQLKINVDVDASKPTAVAALYEIIKHRSGETAAAGAAAQGGGSPPAKQEAPRSAAAAELPLDLRAAMEAGPVVIDYIEAEGDQAVKRVVTLAPQDGEEGKRPSQASAEPDHVFLYEYGAHQNGWSQFAPRRILAWSDEAPELAAAAG